jgi:hypothetical protein
MNQKELLLGFAVLLIIMYLYSRYLESECLTGFWSADPDFCDESGLERFILFIGDLNINGTRSCYLLMQNEEGIILNDPVDVNITGIALSPLMVSKKTYSAYFDMDVDFFSSYQDLTLFPYEGKMILTCDDEVTAVLYKDYVMDDQV